MEKYTPVKTIGQGSFGRALLVQCKNTEHKYVLKEIQFPQNSRLENTRREAVLLSKMRHANIVAFSESFQDGNVLCIIMEYCSGGDLLQRIQQQQKGPFSVHDILKWFAQMCAGAKHIHDKRVLHRDLKSKNIFLTENGTIKLGDFGSACVLNSSKAFAQTYVGTPYYVAPEIWDNQPYNNKSDVWSLGCVLYELCTLRHPFQAASWKSLILKVCRGAYPPLPGHLPYQVHYLLKHMFKTNPKDRPSLHTILTSHRVSKLLREHLTPEVLESEEQEGQERQQRQEGQERRGRRVQRWNPEEGEKVTKFLGQKSLVHTAMSQGTEWAQSESIEPPQRKQWAPSDTVLQKLVNMSLMSDSVSRPSSSGLSRAVGEQEEEREEQEQQEEQEQEQEQEEQEQQEEESGRRRRWSREPPERLLSVLERAPLHRAFSTFIIRTAGTDPLAGPLSDQQGDDTDGLMHEDIDQERLQPRSDDEDTDFEEDSPRDWMYELEKMFPLH
ncbi:serine/threonine-protein kinase Nek3 [Eucyclogobius newberryi]|uniref:serine/threonine-protein kinase Nek3 n=1 Tax=Eucyclogobius newberryi TaxID=166745 RepID=UPI003B59D336